MFEYVGKFVVTTVFCMKQWRTESPPEIPKALQNRAKLNPIVKTVKKKLLNLGRQRSKMFRKRAVKF